MLLLQAASVLLLVLRDLAKAAPVFERDNDSSQQRRLIVFGDSFSDGRG
jgi:hypothetical protein